MSGGADQAASASAAQKQKQKRQAALEEAAVAAAEAKAAGNAALAKGTTEGYREAVAHYTDAIGHDDKNHIFWSNRSAAHLSLGDAQAAASDAEQCVSLSPSWPKGYSRLGAALFAGEDFQRSVEAFAKGLQLDAANAGMLQGLSKAQAKLQSGGGASIQLEPEPEPEPAVRVGGALVPGGFSAGDEVTISGLVGAARHNGKMGRVVSYDGAKGRYVVQLRAAAGTGGETLALKPANLSAAGAGQVDEVKISKKVIGIDLGTTNSCVGVWIDDEVHILTSREGRKTVPSFIAFDGDRRLVGDEAKAQQTRNIQNTVYDVKRIIGQQMGSPGVMADIEKLQYTVKASESGDKPLVEVDYRGRRKCFAPEELSAMVLVKMKEIAEDYLGEQVTRAVITVPAYFGDGQRAATQAAGRIAGLTVERIINEPTAAALAYGLDNLADAEPGKATHILVFDLGGGTFDVSLLKMEDGIFEVVATGGDTRLGGEDFDLAIVEYILKGVQKQHGVNLRGDAKAWKRLKVAAQQAKEALSNSQTFTLAMDGLWEGVDTFELTLTRPQFEKLVEPWTKQALETVKRVLRDAKMKPEAVQELVMVGGSTRVPKVQEDLMAFFGGKALCKSINPDECVAYGAAVQVLLVDVTPLSLGVETEGKAMSVIVKRNTPLPCSKKGMYTTVEDFQTSIDVVIYEGERSSVSGNTQIGEFVITGIERAKRGEAKVEMCMELDANGILKVSARDKVTGAENSVVITNSKGRLSSAEVDRMVAEAAKYAEEDRAFTERLEAKNSLEMLAYNLLELAQEAEIEKLETKAKGVQKWCDDVSLTASTQDYQAKAVELKKLMRKLGVG